MRRLLALLCCVVPLALLVPALAEADVFGPISLVSQGTLGGGATQQAVYAHDPAISGNGQYVAFDGSFGGKTGVFRHDLATGAIEPVAVGAVAEDGHSCAIEQSGQESPCNAELPSISETGRYVSFTTTAALTPEGIADKSKAPNVYVRNMEPQPGEPEYTLASAVTVGGQTQALSYEYASNPETEAEQREFEEEHYGALASGRSALSANGQEVAFVTTAISNLANPAETNTPALQVAVRNLATHETQLVSVAYDPATGRPAVDPETGRQEPVSGEEGGITYGAVYSEDPAAAEFHSPEAYRLQSQVGASISADGSTVAWMGQDVSRQAPFLSGETPLARYSEPLWRRIADGPEAPTRRITGGSDPANPACAASGETILPTLASPSDPCQGPFATERELGVWIGGTGNPVPQLSADGSTVAFLAGAAPVGVTFGEPQSRASDLYVVNMAEGLTRTEALRRLTELASSNAQEPATTAPIVDLAISPDGSQIAFATQRTIFPLGSPAYVSAPAAAPGMVELFDVDLADDTLTRVTHGYDGGAGEAPHGTAVSGQDSYTSSDGALSPSFTDDGDNLAFSSTAANLVYGDGNTPQQPNNPVFDGSDAFVVERVLFPSTPTPQYVSSAPEPPLAPVWNIGVTALSRANGSVLLYVQAPGAGSLRARAQGAVVVTSAGGAHGARTARRTRHASRARVKTKTVATRTVAASTTDTKSAGLATLTLTLTPAYAALASERGGLSATVTLTFTAPGRAALRESIPVTFLHNVKRSKARSSKTGRRSSKARRR
jgi:hypothetical protein